MAILAIQLLWIQQNVGSGELVKVNSSFAPPAGSEESQRVSDVGPEQAESQRISDSGSGA